MRTTRQAWLLFGGMVAMVLIFAASEITFPQTERPYCTADLRHMHHQ
jgi:hypothetical protein